MDDITRGFNRKMFSSFSESDFVTEECEKFTEVSASGFERTMTEEYLKAWFTKLCGDVKSVKMVIDDFGKSLGFCTVSFYSTVDAERAVRVTNNRELNGRILRVKPCKDTEEQNETPDKLVYVKGFGDTLDDIKLEMFFKEHIGGVKIAEVAKFEDGVSKGYGKVEFFNHQDAMKAVLKLNGVKIHGNKLIVEPFKTKEQRNQEPNRTVYVKGFGEILDDDGLRILFETFGKIDSAKVERDVSGKYKGFGYVCFKRYQDSEAAIAEMNGKKLGSNRITVCPLQSKEERQKEFKNRNLHVRNLRDSVSQNELKELFAPYGKILSVRVNTSPRPGISQGHVCFETSKEADNAVAALNLYLYKGLKLKVSPLQPKSEATVKDSDDSTLKSSLFSNDTLQMRRCKKENAYKNRSKSLGNLTENNAKLQILTKLDEGDKHLKRLRSEVPSLIQTDRKTSANPDQTHTPSKLSGKNVSSLNNVHRRIAANFQVSEKPETSGNEIWLPKHAIASQTAVEFSDNQDKNQPRIADEPSPLRVMAIPDLFKEMRTGLLHGTYKSEECDVASQNVCLSGRMQTPSTVIPNAKMNSRERRGKRAYICGGNVKKS